MLNEYLLSPDGVSLDVLPPNEIGFLEYLDDNADNPVARVLALDFFVANLFQVNILLEILRIEPLQSTYHIDLNGLLEAFNALQAKQKLSGTELVALDYYRYVQQRIVNGEPTDKHFTKSTYVCEEHDPVRIFGYKEFYDQHMEQCHQQELFYCNQCPKGFPSNGYRKDHMQSVHTKGLQAFVCPDCHCEKYTEWQLRKHRDSYHAPGAEHICPRGCGFSFHDSRQINRHLKKPCLRWTL